MPKTIYTNTISSSDRVHALNLRDYISQKPGKRISAGIDGWQRYWLDRGLEKGYLKPKALCMSFPDLLVWTSDASAAGLGWISCCPTAGSTCSALSKKKVSSSVFPLFGNELSGIFSGMDLQTTVDYRNKAVSVEGKKVVSKERVVETVVSSVDVVMVVDISESMSDDGRSQETFKAIQGLYKILKPDDRVAIVLFNGTVSKALPLTKVGQLHLHP